MTVGQYARSKNIVFFTGPAEHGRISDMLGCPADSPCGRDMCRSIDAAVTYAATLDSSIKEEAFDVCLHQLKVLYFG